MKNGKKKNGKLNLSHNFVYLSFKYRIFPQMFLRLFLLTDEKSHLAFFVFFFT